MEDILLVAIQAFFLGWFARGYVDARGLVEDKTESQEAREDRREDAPRARRGR